MNPRGPAHLRLLPRCSSRVGGDSTLQTARHHATQPKL
jgi:hypothetical protein